MTSATSSTVREKPRSCTWSFGAIVVQRPEAPHWTEKTAGRLIMRGNIGRTARKRIRLGFARLLWRAADRCNRWAALLFVRALR
jgi:hypothetical protein